MHDTHCKNPAEELFMLGGFIFWEPWDRFLITTGQMETLEPNTIWVRREEWRIEDMGGSQISAGVAPYSPCVWSPDE